MLKIADGCKEPVLQLGLSSVNMYERSPYSMIRMLQNIVDIWYEFILGCGDRPVKIENRSKIIMTR